MIEAALCVLLGVALTVKLKPFSVSTKIEKGFVSEVEKMTEPLAVMASFKIAPILEVILTIVSFFTLIIFGSLLLTVALVEPKGFNTTSTE